MRTVTLLLVVASTLWPQTRGNCACGSRPPGSPANRELAPYAAAPDDLRPFSKFAQPYYEHYTSLIEYNGAARDAPVPALSEIEEVRIGFLGPIANHPEQALGKAMLDGVTLAIEEANAAGGYCGKPFRLMVHNDQALWGSSSNEVVKMVYDEKVWAIFGSVGGDSTHIALRVALRAEVPMVNSAATDPTIPETVIPWYLTVLQDDRVQSYTLARRIYTDLGLKRVAILRINDRYGRFGVGKFKDASRRLGHPVVIEQKYMYGDKDFSRQLRVIQDSGVDAVLLWADAAPAGKILRQMRAMGMKQRVFGGFRAMGEDLFKEAGAAADGMEFVYPYDASRSDFAPRRAFEERFSKRFTARPDTFSSLAFDAMKILLDSICRAGLNRGRIRDALTEIQRYRGVTEEMVFDPNCKNIASMYLGVVKAGRVSFRRYSMDKPYARAGDTPLEYNGPRLPDLPSTGQRTVAIFGPGATSLLQTSQLKEQASGFRLTVIDSETQWGKSTSDLVRVLYDPDVIGVIAVEQKAAHLAAQLANKIRLPVLAITDDRSLASVHIPWVFQVPSSTPITGAVRSLVEAAKKAGPNREQIRDALAADVALR